MLNVFKVIKEDATFIYRMQMPPKVASLDFHLAATCRNITKRISASCALIYFRFQNMAPHHADLFLFGASMQV